MFKSVLVANRGEIARRIIRTARNMGVHAIAIHSEIDADLPFVAEADEAISIGEATPAESYLSIDKILAAAKQSHAQAIHPGYGFLSENSTFARAVQDQGLVWVGPSPLAIEMMGDKVRARDRMRRAGMSVCAGTSEAVRTLEDARIRSREIGFPVMIKAVAGGGGIGMKIVDNEDSLPSAFDMARSAATRSFANPDVFLESYIEGARHVEIQVLGVGDSRVVALGDRDCSVQRRHQKLVEETPSPGVSEILRTEMISEVVKALETIGYLNAGTVECLVEPSTQKYYFIEMNARLQVEHAITEMVTGIDLVEHQLRIAGGESVTLERLGERSGHAIEFRICAEDPVTFLPSPGRISKWVEPVGEGVRVDSGYRSGNTVSRFYDSLLAKLIVHGKNRDDALAKAQKAIRSFEVEGLKTNLPLFNLLLESPLFVSGDYDTSIIEKMRLAS